MYGCTCAIIVARVMYAYCGRSSATAMLPLETGAKKVLKSNRVLFNIQSFDYNATTVAKISLFST